MTTTNLDDIGRFYEAAALGLRVLDGRGGRRLGVDAQATWRAFRGELSDGDRLDLLLRDAAVAHPAAFAPRVVFALEGLADDEPFGPDWPGPEPARLPTLLRTHDDNAPAALVALEEAATLWKLAARTLPPRRLAPIGPASRIVAAGAGAIVAIADYFEGRRDLDLADQVVLVADQPAERQLFGLAGAFLGAPRAVHILDPKATIDDVRSLGIKRFDLLLVADDASDSARRAVTALAPGLARD